MSFSFALLNFGCASCSGSGLLQGGDVELLHLQHGLHDAVGLPSLP
jgi:hypothetical protein